MRGNGGGTDRIQLFDCSGNHDTTTLDSDTANRQFRAGRCRIVEVRSDLCLYSLKYRVPNRSAHLQWSFKENQSNDLSHSAMESGGAVMNADVPL